MNEPATKDSTVFPPTQVEVPHPVPTPGGFGRALAQARLRTGLSQEQMAASLRLHPRQLAALENEDLDKLPAPAYVNGFVRNYARELKLDPGPLIEDLNQKVKLKGRVTVPDLGIAGGEVRPQTLDDRGWRQMVLAGIVLALVCAAVIGTWMASPHPGATAGHPAPGTGAPSARASQSVAPAVPAPAPAGEADGGTTPATPGGPPAASGTATPAAPAQPAAKPQVDAANAANSAPNVAPQAAVTTAPADVSRGPTSLVLRFNDRSWFEVSDPAGRVLLSRNGEPGSTELLNTSAPLRLVVGRAGAVEVEYRGHQVDLKPYSNSNGVARLLLAEGRVTGGGQ